MDSELYYIYTSTFLVIILLLFSLKQKLNYFDKCYSYSGIIITIFFILSLLFELKIFIFTCHVSLVIFIMILSFIIENKIIIITNLTVITMIVVSWMLYNECPISKYEDITVAEYLLPHIRALRILISIVFIYLLLKLCKPIIKKYIK